MENLTLEQKIIKYLADKGYITNVGDVTTAHQILFITLAVDNTKAISAADVANCKVEIL